MYNVVKKNINLKKYCNIFILKETNCLTISTDKNEIEI